MKVAVPVWEGRVSPVFDTARRLAVLDVDGGKTLSRHEETLADEPTAMRVSRLVTMGVEVLVCGAISRAVAEMVGASGIRLIPFVSGDVEEVIQAFPRGDFPSPAFLMPGCCGRRHGFRGGRGRRRSKGGIR